MSDQVTDSNNGEFTGGIKQVVIKSPFDTFKLDFSSEALQAVLKKENSTEDPRAHAKEWETLTFGEKLVRASFNPSALGEVSDFKQVISVLANHLHYSRMPEVNPEQYQPDYLKNAKKAVEYLELAQMFAVKAFTSPVG